MSDYSELELAAQRIVEVQTSQDVPIGILFDQFEALASPEAVLALIAANERLKAGVESDMAEIDRIQGEYDKQFRKARELRIERDQLRYEIAGLKTGYEAYERVNAELKAECEALRKDDLRAGLMALAAYIGPICTAAVTAAMDKGGRS